VTKSYKSTVNDKIIGENKKKTTWTKTQFTKTR